MLLKSDTCTYKIVAGVVKRETWVFFLKKDADVVKNWNMYILKKVAAVVKKWYMYSKYCDIIPGQR